MSASRLDARSPAQVSQRPILRGDRLSSPGNPRLCLAPGPTATYMFGLSAADGSVLFQSQMSAQWEHYLAPTVANGIVYTDGGEYGGM